MSCGSSSAASTSSANAANTSAARIAGTATRVTVPPEAMLFFAADGRRLAA